MSTLENWILLSLALFCFLVPGAVSAVAFDDDSTDDSQPIGLVRTLCEDGRTLVDTGRVHFSCSGDEVYLDRIQPFLYKNEIQISAQPVLDFKISRNGKVFYRGLTGQYLFDENGMLESGASPVVVYLVSSSGDVVYLNENGQLYKNGIPLTPGTFTVPLVIAPYYIQGRRRDRVVNPAVSRGGHAVYLNNIQNLFIDDRQLNDQIFQVVDYKINSNGDVYILDQRDRLFRNDRKLYNGMFPVLEFALNVDGKVAFLIDLNFANLYFEGRRLSAGANRILSFHFNNRGDILYQDSRNRLWKNGVLIND